MDSSKPSCGWKPGEFQAPWEKLGEFQAAQEKPGEFQAP